MKLRMVNNEMHQEIINSFERQVGYIRNQLLSGDYKGFVESVQLFTISMETRVNQIGEEGVEDDKQT